MQVSKIFIYFTKMLIKYINCNNNNIFSQKVFSRLGTTVSLIYWKQKVSKSHRPRWSTSTNWWTSETNSFPSSTRVPPPMTSQYQQWCRSTSFCSMLVFLLFYSFLTTLRINYLVEFKKYKDCLIITKFKCFLVVYTF